MFDLRFTPHAKAFIEGQLASGRYADVGDVVHDALRLPKTRQERLETIDASISRGLADIAAGGVHGIDVSSMRSRPGLNALDES